MLDLLRQLRENLYLLKSHHHNLILKIVNLKCFEKSESVIEEFQLFLIDLLTIENRFSGKVISTLVEYWIPNSEY